MLNFKIANAVDKFLELKGGSYSYTFRGEEYNITRESIRTVDTKLQQSFGGFVSRNSNSPRKVQTAPDPGAKFKTKIFTPEKVYIRGSKDRVLVRQELLRLATVPKIIEEKLNYPKVFQALLTEPHTAFDHKKKHEETEINLTLFVDHSVGYHREIRGCDQGLHDTIISVAKTIKGINVFDSYAIYNTEYKGQIYPYYTDLLKVLPEKMKRKVLVFTQGCGTAENYRGIKEESLTFCTPFSHYENCGCDRIDAAARAKQIMVYSFRTANDFKILK